MPDMQTTLNPTPSSSKRVLYMAFELSIKDWVIAFTTGQGEKIIVRRCPARDQDAFLRVLTAILENNCGPGGWEVRSVYEAGFDAFWLHNVLTSLGILNIVMDPASIEVNQRKRRSKSDRLDVRQLVRKLVQYYQGDTEVWSVCRTPARGDEEDRRLEREHQRLTQETTAHRNRLLGLFRARGIEPVLDDRFFGKIDDLRCGDDTLLAFFEKEEMRREYARLKLAEKHLQENAANVAERLKRCDLKAVKTMKLTRLKGIGARLAWGLVAELFGWREFKSRDALSSYVGLDSAPYDTGLSTGRSQGISKAGNVWVRAILHSIAINWLRWQPQSELTQWYRKRCDNASRDVRRKGLVALARKILVRLWHWVEFDTLPNGAVLSENPS